MKNVTRIKNAVFNVFLWFKIKNVKNLTNFGLVLSGKITILEYNAQKNIFDRIHMETFGKSGSRRIVPGACDKVELIPLLVAW